MYGYSSCLKSTTVTRIYYAAINGKPDGRVGMQWGFDLAGNHIARTWGGGA